MTERERELISAEAKRHAALAEVCVEDDLCRHHEEVAVALLSALEERDNSGKIQQKLYRRAARPAARAGGSWRGYLLRAVNFFKR